MNNNAYFIKAFTDTEFRNIETYFNDCEVSVSQITGLGEFGEPKNILIEEYADKRESDLILPPNNEDVIYKPTDVVMTILIQGNSQMKVGDQAARIMGYISRGINIKDMARVLCNKLILIGSSTNKGKVTLSESKNEYVLLTLKFKKLFDCDLQFVTDMQTEHFDSDPTILYLQSKIQPKYFTKGFVECGVMYKTGSGSYQKHVSDAPAPVPTHNYAIFNNTVTGLQPNTLYTIKPFFTSEFETFYGTEFTASTLA